MINKEKVWFVTLLSLIVVLSVYYIAMPDSNLISNITTNNEESTELVALRVEADEEMLNEMENLQSVLLSETSSIDDKNNAYVSLKELNTNKGVETDLESIILKEFGYNSFIKIKGDNISVVINSKEHNTDIANKIIRRIQKNYDVVKYITVKFQ